MKFFEHLLYLALDSTSGLVLSMATLFPIFSSLELSDTHFCHDPKVSCNNKVETGQTLLPINLTFWHRNVRIDIDHIDTYFSTKTYAVGTQKIHLNETVLLSTQNKY